MKCRWCLDYHATRTELCHGCNQISNHIRPENADHVIARAIELLGLTGPTARLFIGQAKLIAMAARGEA